jgi:hypothetical protein
MRPTTINILGIDYAVTYCANPVDVDIQKRETCWGQIDFWTRTIRIFDDGNRPEGDVFQAILHEVLHGISDSLHLILEKDKYHTDLDRLALALADVLVRNEWVEIKDLGRCGVEETGHAPRQGDAGNNQ